MPGRLSLTLLTGCLVASSSASWAQPVEPEAPPPDEAPPVTEPLPTDGSETLQLYEGAFDAFAAGHYLEAATAFDEVARRTVDPNRRAAATELAAQSRARIGRTPPAPPALTPPVLRPPPRARHPRAPSDGRTYLLGGTSLLGLGFYGWALPLALSVDDTRAFVGTYMLTAGTAFFGPYFATSGGRVPWGSAVLGVSGGLHGVGHGVLFFMLLGGDTDDTETLLGGMVLTSLAEGISHYAWASAAEMTSGEAHAVAAGANIGLGAALEFDILALGDGFGDADPALTAGVLLAGAGAGTVAGALLPWRARLTWGDVELIHSGALLGTYVGLVPAILAEADDPRVFGALALFGTLGGAAAAHFVVDDRDVTAGQAILVDLGTVAGGAMVAGLTYVLTGAETDASARAIATLGALGACGGFALTFLTLDPSHERRGPESEPPSSLLLPTFGPDGYRGLALASTF